MPDPSARLYTVLFLGTANTARSVMAEAVLRRYGVRRFQAYSAGIDPVDSLHPQTRRVLQIFNYRTDLWFSKNWDLFAEPDGPPLDLVITLSDGAAGRKAQFGRAHPLSAHWDTPDPTVFKGDDHEVLRVFRTIFLQLERRIKALTSVPLDELSLSDQQAAIDDIGQPLPPIAAAA